MEPIESLKDEKPNLEEDVLWDDWKHPMSALYTSKKLSQLLIHSGNAQDRFRYEDGSNPDELAST